MPPTKRELGASGPWRGKGSGHSDKKGTTGRGSSGKGDRTGKKPKTEWGDHCKEHAQLLKNPTGRSRQYAEVAAFLCAVFKLRAMHKEGKVMNLAKGKPADSNGDMIKYVHFVGKMMGMAEVVRNDVWQTYRDEQAVLVNENKRGRASPNYVLDDARKLKPAHLASIESFIATCHGPKGGGRVTLASIKKHLLEEFSAVKAYTRQDKDLVLTDIKSGVIRYALVNWLGYSWGKIRLRKINGDPHRPELIRTYCKAYADALQKERDGTHVIVYTDESYIHQNHAPTESWLKDDSDKHVDRSSSKGKRLIILHAISKFGPIGQEDKSMTWSGDTPHTHSENPASSETAELLWVSNSSSGDYHDNMDGQMFMKWVKEKLRPAFKKFCIEKFGEEKKMILVLDVSDAPHHHPPRTGPASVRPALPTSA